MSVPSGLPEFVEGEVVKMSFPESNRFLRYGAYPTPAWARLLIAERKQSTPWAAELRVATGQSADTWAMARAATVVLTDRPRIVSLSGSPHLFCSFVNVAFFFFFFCECCFS